MDLLFLDSSLVPVGMTDSVTSCRWTRRFFGLGDFTLSLPDPSLLPANTRFLYRLDTGGCAILEARRYEVSENGQKTLTLSGNLLEGLLANRVIEADTVLSGQLETAVRGLVTQCAVTGSRAIPGLTLGDSIGVTTPVSAIAFGTTLPSFLYPFLMQYALSFSLSADPDAHQIRFALKKGLDRTQEQNANIPAVFSTDFGNLRGVKCVRDTQSARNFAYIAVRTADGDPLLTTVSSVLPGEERRELFVPASDIARFRIIGGVRTAIPEEEYLSLLADRGRQRLARSVVTTTFTGTLSPETCPLYGGGFDLGDLCCCEEPGSGLSASLRLTETTETTKDGLTDITVVFTD